ncbi:MAG: hypothetical protein HY834_17310 [Devosia nanyangense]|uniref:Xylulokinase n=1 Tax=Devosia nanyangense TaxID=1228055 RepID=A0A933L711_9HYPH|nr:hypothetical protein [Devosia nanyangense]
MPTLGVDVGTQSLKAVVLGDQMQALGAGSVGYRPAFPQPGWAEQDPRHWLAALRPAIAAALAEARVTSRDIAALAVCGQLDGCVPTDGEERALAPAIIWMDRRAESLLAAIDPALIRDRCGLVLDATHMGAKIAWLDAHLPQRGEVATWHQPVSFLVAALTGRRVVSHSLASTTMLYDMHKGDWDDALLALFGTRRDQLPSIAGDAEIAGLLTAEGADLTGLHAGLPVAVGTGDDFSNPLGCGIHRPGIVAVSLGTAETVAALSDRDIVDPGMLVETHAFPGGRFHLGNPGWLSGGAVRWASALLSIAGDEAFSARAAEAPPGCDGVTFIPALSGAMSPKWIAAARGSFIGLTPSHGASHLARAVLEGTAFAMRDVIDRLDALGVPTTRLRLMGGGARSDLWCQIRADVSGRPAELLTESDASAIGAALLAAVAAGIMPDIGTACAALRLPMRSIAPGPPVYDDAYRRYRDGFAALEPLWR